MSAIIREVTIGPCRLIQGDCLEVLPTLPRVDAVITDPPYMIGAVSTGVENAKCGTWADMQNAAFWFSGWFAACRDRLKDTGHLATFGNWRSMPTLICALSKIKWSATSCIVWDKQWIGPAYINAFRPTWELILTAAMPEAEVKNRSAADVYRGEKWLAGQCKTTNHPAEKPVDVVAYLVNSLTPDCGLFADPFMGSGTGGVAAIATDRSYIGIEMESSHFDTACSRIRRAWQDKCSEIKWDEPAKQTQLELVT